MQGIVAVFGNGARRELEGPVFEGIGVGAEAEVACEGHEERALPVALRLLEVGQDAVRLGFQSLDGQRVQPAVRRQCRHVGYHAVAGRVGFLGQQFGIVLAHRFGHLQYQLRQGASVLRLHRHVRASHHVEHHVVVGFVRVVVVAIPVGGSIVNFHVAHPERAADFDFRIKEVGPLVPIVQSRVDDVHLLSVCSGQRAEGEELVFPHVM